MMRMRFLVTAWSLMCLLMCMQGSIVQAASDLYCGNENCYQVMGLQQSASASDIRSAYKKLALTYHPDKNPDADPELFRGIANAYQVLKDKKTRAEYDDMLNNPHAFRHQLNYWKYRAKSNVWVVLAGLFAFAVAAHYMHWKARYRMSVRAMETHPTVIQKVMLLQKSNPWATWRDVVQLQGTYARPPTYSDLLVVSIFFWPWNLFEFVFFHVRWWYKFEYKKEELGEREKEILMASHLGIPWSRWVMVVADEKKEEWTSRELWIPEKFRAFKKESQAEAKRSGGGGRRARKRR